MQEIEVPGIELSDFVGSGANASVFAGIDEDSGERVAVKVMHVGIDGGERRFERETEAMARLSEVEGVVPLLRSGLLGSGRPYLVTALYERSLQKVIDEQEPMESTEASRLVAVVADADAAVCSARAT